MVSTLDFESNDPGSNPGRTFLINIININNILVRVAQWIERLTSNQKVAGSSPVMDILSGFPSLVKGVRLKFACNMLRGFKSLI